MKHSHHHAGHGEHGGHPHAHEHAHSHGSQGQAGHAHHHDHAASRWLPLALTLTLSFALVEAIAGWWSGSLALLGDAGHMATDSMALGLAAVAARLAKRPASEQHSFGLQRVESLAALANSVFMLLLVAALAWQAVLRLLAPREIAGEAVTLVALAGLGINLLVAWLLTRGEGDLNTRGALIHVMGDLLGSVAALSSGLVIQLTGWTPIDPLLTMLISGLILASTVNLLRRAVHTLLEGVPEGISLQEVGTAMAGVKGVASVHDLHIWSLDSRRSALSAHVVVADWQRWLQILPAMQQLLARRFGIEHVTLQPELPPAEPLVFTPLGSRSSDDHG